MPIILLFSNDKLLPSLSHYYYSKGAVFFVAILSAFGLFLISYKGFDKSEDEIISDNMMTIIGGICVLLVVLIPTSCLSPIAQKIIPACSGNEFPLYGHDNKALGTVHLILAGIFLFSMGHMSFYKFTKSKRYITFFQVCGIVVWLCIALLAMEFLFQFSITDYDVFFLETIAVVFFGASWLIKGEVLEGMGLVKKKSYV